MSATDSAEKASTASILHGLVPVIVGSGGCGGSSGKTDSQDYQSSWISHAYDGFPREVWDGDRSSKWRLIGSRDEFLTFLQKQRDNFGPAHTSVNIGTGPVLGPGYSKPWIDKMLLELDGSGERPDSAYLEMRRLCSHLKLKYDAEPRVYFSGHRSFHVFVDFSPLSLDNPVDAQREFAQLLVKEVGLEHLDHQVFGERKLSRIPYTHHEDTIDYCVPVSPSWTLSEIRTEARRPVRFEPIRVTFAERFAAKLRDIDCEVSSKPRPKVMRGKASTEWIEKLLQRPIADGRHRVLWHILSPYLVNVRKLPMEQAEYRLREYFTRCSALHSLSPSNSSFVRLIRYYLRVAQRDGFPPWRLETIEKNDPQLFDVIREATT